MHKKLLLSFVLFVSLYSTAQTTVIDSIFCGGVYRNYRLYIPAAYNGTTAYPLILNIHGYTSNAAAQQLYTVFEPIADTAHFLMVYPNATVYMGQPTWNSGFGMAVDDIGFLSDLIDSLSASYNIDQNSVYSTGMSNGGFMSHTLACALSNKIAAIASVTGSMTPFQKSTCSAGRAVPVMQIHGTADGTVPYAGTTTSLNIDTLVHYWVVNNNCNLTPVYNAMPDINTSDGATADHYVWNGGDHGSTVELYKINGGGHTWPGSPYIVGVTDEDFNASEKIWIFFRKYHLSQFTGVNELELPESVSVYPNPSNGLITINADRFSSATIMDVNGKAIVASTKKEIDISSLQNGVYFVVVWMNKNQVVRKFVKI